MSAYDYTIDELPIKTSVGDKDLLIIQDEEDTKQVTFERLRRSLSGDEGEPDSNKYYSSSKTSNMFAALERELSLRASTRDVDALKSTIADIAANQISEDGMVQIIELIAARDGCSSLSERLQRDMRANVNTLLHKYKRTTSGTRINLTDFKGYGDIFLDVDPSITEDITVHSANYFDIERMRGSNEVYISYSEYGFTYTQFSIGGDNFCGVFLPCNIPTGSYYFSANTYIDDVIKDGRTIRFKPTTVRISLRYSDRTYSYMEMDIRSIHNSLFSFQFVNNKPVIEIGFVFPEEDFVTDSTLRFENVMVTPTKVLNDFIEYKVETYRCTGKRYISNLYLEKCEIYVEGFSSNLILDYYDNKYSTEFIVDTLLTLQSNVNEDIDQCGLIDTYGIYNFFENPVKRSTNGMVELSTNDKYFRNGHRSATITLTSDEDVVISTGLENVPTDVDTVSILFYVDSMVSYYMKEEAIEVYLVSDGINTYPHNNYYHTTIPRNMIVQGWNTYKIILSECETIGNPSTISSITLAVTSNPLIVNAVVHFNSVIFNQRMKPTVIFALDGIREHTFTYTLPLFLGKDYNCTLFMNDSIILDNERIDSLISYRVSNTDVGQYGCNPMPELLTSNTNYREQFVALKNIRDYLRETIVDNPVSYSAPSDLRSLTVTLLQEMGYGAAKVNVEAPLSFFSKKDFAIPSYRINNNQDIDMIKDVIDRAVRYGQCVCISVFDVSTYGDEYNSMQADLSAIIAHVDEYVSAGQMQVLSMKDFIERTK